MRLHARTEKTKKKPQTVKTHDRVSQHQNQKSKDALNASPHQNRKAPKRKTPPTTQNRPDSSVIPKRRANISLAFGIVTDSGTFHHDERQTVLS